MTTCMRRFLMSTPLSSSSATRELKNPDAGGRDAANGSVPGWPPASCHPRRAWVGGEYGVVRRRAGGDKTLFYGAGRVEANIWKVTTR